MILYGKVVAEKIYQNLIKKLEALKQKNIQPSLAVILVGEEPASLTYVKVKEKIAERLNIGFRLFHLSGIVREDNVKKLIEELNQNKYVSGIIVQLPLPECFEVEKILKLIAPQKDIDGFYGNFPPPTAQAILEILKYYNISLKEKKIVIIGQGRLVGQPLKRLLLKQGLKPVICDSKTNDLSAKTKSADIIVTATGVPALIKSTMVNVKTTIIDAGASEAKGKIVGDVDREVYKKVQSYTPVPGGVGPVTVAILMRNIVAAAKLMEK